tara:strand:- start:2390 stop:3214 length:825 start_codon:yes stop_codon:yes gene_type:complete
MYRKLEVIDIINKKSKFNFSQILNDGFSYGIRSVGWMILLFIIYLVFNSLFDFIPPYYIFHFDVKAVVAQIFISTGISGGIALFYQRRIKKGLFDFADVFRGYQTNYGNLVAFGAISFALLVVYEQIISFIFGISIFNFSNGFTEVLPAINSIMMKMMDNIGLILGVAIISVLLYIVIQIFMFFSTYFIVIGGLNAIDSIELSARLASKCFFSLFFLMLFLLIFNAVGAIFIGLGLLVTIPISLAICYSVFNTMIEVHIGEEDNQFYGEDIIDV